MEKQEGKETLRLLTNLVESLQEENKMAHAKVANIAAGLRAVAMGLGVLRLEMQFDLSEDEPVVGPDGQQLTEDDNERR